jgi:hypothetical protein
MINEINMSYYNFFLPGNQTNEITEEIKDAKVISF